MLSLSSNRSNAVSLAGQTVGGNIYVFVSPESGASRVSFYLDNPSATGTPLWTETNPPWDFAGGTVSTANPYDTAKLSNGSHSITAAITLTAGGTTTTTATFTVNNGGSPTATKTATSGPAATTTPTRTPTTAPVATATPTRTATTAPVATATQTRTPVAAPTATPTSSSYTLMLSLSSNRSNPAPLGGQTVGGNIYVFVRPESGASRVSFYLDNPTASGSPTWSESNPPWDFAGGTVSAANPYNSANLFNGSHSITAAITFTSGGTMTTTSNFTVNNGGTGTSCSAGYDQVHLAWVGEPSTTLDVVWRTCDTATASSVQYRAAGSTTWLSATGALRTSGTAGTLHEVGLTGLSPATAYEYRVQGDDGGWSSTFPARTAPAAGPATFDAIFYADTGLVGRTDGLASGTQQVVDEIVKLNPLLVLPGGDYAYFDTDKRYGTLDNTIDAWFNQNQPVASRSLMMPTYGNHEVELGENVYTWIDRFPSPSGYDSRRNYSFDVGDVHFISLDASTDSRGLTTGQKQWLESDMQAAKNAGKRWIIPYYHVSPFADGTNHSSNLLLRADVGPIFEKYGVKIALSAHDQAYERSYPLLDVPATNTRTSTSLTCYTHERRRRAMSRSARAARRATSAARSRRSPANPRAGLDGRTRQHDASLRAAARVPVGDYGRDVRREGRRHAAGDPG